MAVYPGEFAKKSDVEFALRTDDLNSFSVLITNRYKTEDTSPISIALAAKPLIYVSSLCGLQMFQYTKNKIGKLSKYRRLYSLILICLVVILTINIKPVSWSDTRVDIPLNILTKAFGSLHNIEIICCITISSFCNSTLNVKFFTILDAVDRHLKSSKNCFKIMRWLSVFLILMACHEFFCTFFLRKFVIRNLPVHLTFFILMTQGSIIVFLVINLCLRQTMLNSLLERKAAITIGKSEERTFKSNYSVWEKIKTILKISTGKNAEDATHYCWLELMQIYDKISDGYYLFNKMYGVQILFMFLTWLVCTILLICRSLSPSLKYSELFLSDLFLYTCINSRPFFLAIMCEVIVKERTKTLDILLRVLVRGNLDEAYHGQVQTMVELVETRRLEISTNIFLANIPTVVNFAGKAISYAVLMIQYFYNHVFESQT